MVTVKQDESLTFDRVLREADSVQKSIDGKASTVAQHLFLIAQQMTSAEGFEAGCKAAESDRRARIDKMIVDKGIQKSEASELRKLPQVWKNAKTVLYRGWLDFGLIPNDAETFSAYKAATIAARKAKGEQERKASKEASGEGPDLLDMLKEGDTFSVIFKDVLARAHALPQKYQEELADHMDKLLVSMEKAAAHDAEVQKANAAEVAKARANAATPSAEERVMPKYNPTEEVELSELGDLITDDDSMTDEEALETAQKVAAGNHHAAA